MKKFKFFSLVIILLCVFILGSCTTINPNSPIELDKPAKLVIDENYVLHWRNVEFADEYKIQIGEQVFTSITNSFRLEDHLVVGENIIYVKAVSEKANYLSSIAAKITFIYPMENNAPSDDNNNPPSDDNNNPSDDNQEGKIIHLTYSGTVSEKEFNLQLFEDFKAERKAAGDKNTYVIEYIENLPESIHIAILDWSSPNAPDVYEFTSDTIGSLLQKDALTKLSLENAEYVKNSISKNVLDSITFNDEIYAYPYTGDNTYYLQYDKSAFSTEEVVSMEGLLAAANKKGYQVGYDLETAYWGSAAMLTFGADYNMVYDEEEKTFDVNADFNGPKGLMAAKAIYKIINDPAWVNTSGVPNYDYNIKAVIGGTWAVSSFKDYWGDNYGCAVMPTVTVDGQTKHLGCFIGGEFLGINPQKIQGDTEKLIAANELAKFLSGKECQTKRLEEYGIYPCHIDVQNHPIILEDPNMMVLRDQLEFAHIQGSVPYGFWQAHNPLMVGIKDGTYILDNLQDAIDLFNTAVTGK